MSVLFVCLGNICRSPAGEEILRQKAKKAGRSDIDVASCGLGDWHVGQLPHGKMRSEAKERGYDLTSRGQQFRDDFFEKYDYILAADHEVMASLHDYTQKEAYREKIHLMTVYSAQYSNQEVPDPYFLSDESFEHVLNMLEDSCDGLLARL